MITELAYLAIVFKVVGSLQGIIGIPINKLTGVLFANAFKRNDEVMMNKIYNYVTRYYLFSYGLLLCTLFFSGNYLISSIYHIETIKYAFPFYLLYIFTITITSTDNWLTSINEHYKVVLFQNIITIPIMIFIYSNYVKIYGIIAIISAIFSGYMIYNIISMLYTKVNYKKINYPVKFLFAVLISLLFSLTIASINNNIILSSSLPFISYLVFFFYLYRIDEIDKEAIDIFKIHDLLKRYSFGIFLSRKGK